MSPEAQPVYAVFDLADVADRTQPYAVGQLEHPRDGEHRTLLRVLVAGPRIRDGVVILGGDRGFRVLADVIYQALIADHHAHNDVTLRCRVAWLSWRMNIRANCG